MQLFSKGGLYIGIDDHKFTDISIHIWKFRLEYCQEPPKSSESTTETGDRPASS